MFDKNNKRSLRRWKTECKHNQRAKMFANTRWYILPSFSDRIKQIKEEKYRLLENPKDCSCSMCSNKHSWTHRKYLRDMRNECQKMVDNFFLEEYNVKDDEDDGAVRQTG